MRAVLATLMLVLSSPAFSHDLHNGSQHVSYQNWINKDGRGCCNNQDCRPASDDEIQFSPVLKVRIDGQWCPVLPQHYLKQGNAPDWQANHVCISLNASLPACERLLCFQPKPLF